MFLKICLAMRFGLQSQRFVLSAWQMTISFLFLLQTMEKGFSDKELMTAAKPYYSEQAEKRQFHFGLELHICRTLCEKHSESLRLENTDWYGVKVTATFFSNK